MCGFSKHLDVEYTYPTGRRNPSSASFSPLITPFGGFKGSAGPRTSQLIRSRQVFDRHHCGVTVTVFSPAWCALARIRGIFPTSMEFVSV